MEESCQKIRLEVMKINYDAIVNEAWYKQRLSIAIQLIMGNPPRR